MLFKCLYIKVYNILEFSVVPFAHAQAHAQAHTHKNTQIEI